MARLVIAAQMQHEEHALHAVEERRRPLVRQRRCGAVATHQRDLARTRQQIFGVRAGVEDERCNGEQDATPAAIASGRTERSTSPALPRRSQSATAATNINAGGTDQYAG